MSCSYCDQVCESDMCRECRNAVESIHDGISGWDFVCRHSSNQQKVRVTYIVQISRIGEAPYSVKQFTRDLEIFPVVLRMMEMGEDNFREASRKGLALNPAFQKFYDWETIGFGFLLPGEVLVPVTKKFIAIDAVLL